MNTSPGTFQPVIDALLDMSRPFPPADLHKFSDISPEDLSLLEKHWDDVLPARKISILEDLEEIAESDTLVCFDDFGRFVIKHEDDPQVLAAAIRLLWECEDPKLVPIFLEKLSHPDGSLRAAAAQALGLFVYLGELEEIPKELENKIENTLLAIYSSDPDILVKRKALESLGYSPRREVIKHIQDAYNEKIPAWQASALYAMGRSADLRWKKHVLANIRNENPEIQTEAIRAAGLLELAEARPSLLELIKHPFDLDVDIRSTTIWSLSQIGGKKVRKVIQKILDETDDEEEIIFIENALENLEFSESFPDLNIMNIDIENLGEDEDLNDYFPLDELDDDDDEWKQ